MFKGFYVQPFSNSLSIKEMCELLKMMANLSEKLLEKIRVPNVKKLENGTKRSCM